VQALWSRWKVTSAPVGKDEQANRDQVYNNAIIGVLDLMGHEADRVEAEALQYPEGTHKEQKHKKKI
jgi:hypothetical protein